MDIPPVDAAVIAALKLDAVAPINANTVRPTVTVTVTGADATASIVEFSPLAHLLAVTVLFQTPQSGSSAGSTSLNFQQLAQAAGNFVEAFNSFQNTVNASSATPFESAFDSALLSALQNQNIQSGSASVQSFIDSMAQVGINFQGATDLINPNQFQFNMTALQAAYNENSVQTSGLLNNAFQALSSIERQLLLAQSSQTPGASLMTPLPTAVVSAANRTANNTNPAAGANGTTGSATPNVAGVAGSAAPAIASANARFAVTASSAATAAAATASPAVAPPSAAGVTTLATVAAMTNPATRDPIVALAVAAYRVTESMEHTPVSQPANPVDEVMPDVTETDRVEPVGPDTPRTQMPAGRTRPGH